VFTARYALSPYIKQICLVSKGLILLATFNTTPPSYLTNYKKIYSIFSEIKHTGLTAGYTQFFLRAGNATYFTGRNINEFCRRHGGEVYFQTNGRRLGGVWTAHSIRHTYTQAKRINLTKHHGLCTDVYTDTFKRNPYVLQSVETFEFVKRVPMFIHNVGTPVFMRKFPNMKARSILCLKKLCISLFMRITTNNSRPF
jgi:hypothetical protein